MNAVPMIAVLDVRASAQFYEGLLGAVSGHGGDEYEQLLVDGKLVLQLHDCREDTTKARCGMWAWRPATG